MYIKLMDEKILEFGDHKKLFFIQSKGIPKFIYCLWLTVDYWTATIIEIFFFINSM